MEKVLRLSVRGQWRLSAGQLGAYAEGVIASASSTKFFGTSPRKNTEKLG
jgi:hypothetical protein